MIFICEAVIALIIYYEYKKYKTAVAPIVILGGVYLIFIPLINTIGVSLDFLKLSDKTIILFTVFLLLLYSSGRITGVFYSKKKRYSVIEIENKIILKENSLWHLYMIGLGAYVISLIQVINKYGFENTKSNAFGPFAHIGFISRCLFPIIVYYAIKRRKMKYMISIIINIIALILFKGKYHLYIAISAAVVLFLLLRKDIKISRIIKIAISTFCIALVLFVSVYTILPNIIAGDTSSLDMMTGIRFSVKHFFHYLFCPFIASNEYFNNPCYLGMDMGLKTVLNPFYRLFQWIYGNGKYFDPIISLWPTVDLAGNTGNVGGIFSETVLNIGYAASLIYIFLIGCLVYSFFYKTIFKGKRVVTSIYLIGMFMVCFFCNYFSLLPNLECFIICYLVDVILLDNRIKIGKYKLITKKKR